MKRRKRGRELLYGLGNQSVYAWFQLYGRQLGSWVFPDSQSPVRRQLHTYLLSFLPSCAGCEAVRTTSLRARPARSYSFAKRLRMRSSCHARWSSAAFPRFAEPKTGLPPEDAASSTTIETGSWPGFASGPITAARSKQERETFLRSCVTMRSQAVLSCHKLH